MPEGDWVTASCISALPTTLGVNDGIRTHERQVHNLTPDAPGSLTMVDRVGLEPTITCL